MEEKPPGDRKEDMRKSGREREGRIGRKNEI